MKILNGKSATTGVAIGPATIWKDAPEVVEKKITDIDKEIKHFDDAFNIVVTEMDEFIKNADKNTAEIIEARKMMLEDKAFIDDIKKKIKEGYASEYATFIVAKGKAKLFETMDNEYLRSRSIDIIDVANKLIGVLIGAEGRKAPNVPSIIIADEITPEEITGINREKVLAFVTKKGSMASHASIVAGNCGIPYIFGIDYNENELNGIKVAAVDTEKGIFILDPDEKTISLLKEKQLEAEKNANNYKDATYMSKVNESLKKLGIHVYANIAGPEDVKSALENGADGVGLYRTEFLYMKKDTLPTEDEQYEAYKNVLEQMGDREVIIRTMDIGADKKAKCLNLPDEENPALGRRAIRICLDDVELFRTQLRALLRAAVFGNEKIMFPMIASPKEIDDIKEQINIAEKELNDRKVSYKIPKIGIMIEIPAAAILSREFAKKVDFFSIGTNDLTQYTLAVDRTGKNLDRYYRSDDEAVLSLIEMTVSGAHAEGIPVGICGEMGGNEKLIPRLVEMGIDEFSMSPSKILKSKDIISKCSKGEKKVREQVGNEVIKKGYVSPVDGTLVAMEKIPDPVFASGDLGRCIGIEPDNGNVYAPCDGVIITVAETKHAISIRTDSGSEILLHIGIDTVKLNGKGFDCKVKVSDKIKKGDLLLVADIAAIKKEGLSPMVVMIVTKE